MFSPEIVYKVGNAKKRPPQYENEEEYELPSTQPVDIAILKNVVAYVEVRCQAENRSRGVAKQLELLGATVVKKFGPEVTHVIWKDGKKATKDKAMKKGLHLLSVLWVESCKQNQDHVAESLFPVEDPNKDTPLIVGRLKRYKSMQPKDLEEELKNSGEKIRRRRRRNELKSPAPFPGHLLVRDTPYISPSLKYLNRVYSSPSLIPDTPATMRACLDRLKDMRKIVAPAQSLNSAVRNSPSNGTMSPLERRQVFGPLFSTTGLSDDENSDPVLLLEEGTSTRKHGSSSASDEIAKNSLTRNEKMPVVFEEQEKSSKVLRRSRRSHVVNLTVECQLEELPVTKRRKSVPYKSVRTENVLQSTNTEENVRVRGICLKDHGGDSNLATEVLSENTIQMKDIVPKDSEVQGNCGFSAKAKLEGSRLSKRSHRKKSSTANQTNNSSVGSNRLGTQNVQIIDLDTPDKQSSGLCSMNSSLEKQNLVTEDAKTDETKKGKVGRIESLHGNSLVDDPPTKVLLLEETSSGTPKRKRASSEKKEEEGDKPTKKRRLLALEKGVSTPPLLFEAKESADISRLKGIRGFLEESPSRHRLGGKKKKHRNDHSVSNCEDAAGPQDSEDSCCSHGGNPPKKKRVRIQSGSGNSMKVPKPNIVLTSIHASEQGTIFAIVRSMGGFKISDAVNAHTTHVVTGDERRTLNVLSAIGRGCWLLSKEWILNSLDNGSWLPEEPFEVHNYFPSAKLSRQLKSQLTVDDNKASVCKPHLDLFSEHSPMFVTENSSPPPERLVELIKLCGGTVCKTIRQATLCIGTLNGRANAPVVKEKWILDCISEMKCLSLEEYLHPS